MRFFHGRCFFALQDLLTYGDPLRHVQTIFIIVTSVSLRIERRRGEAIPLMEHPSAHSSSPVLPGLFSEDKKQS